MGCGMASVQNYGFEVVQIWGPDCLVKQPLVPCPKTRADQLKKATEAAPLPPFVHMPQFEKAVPRSFPPLTEFEKAAPLPSFSHAPQFKTAATPPLEKAAALPPFDLSAEFEKAAAPRSFPPLAELEKAAPLPSFAAPRSGSEARGIESGGRQKWRWHANSGWAAH